MDRPTLSVFLLLIISCSVIVLRVVESEKEDDLQHDFGVNLGLFSILSLEKLVAVCSHNAPTKCYLVLQSGIKVRAGMAGAVGQYCVLGLGGARRREACLRTLTAPVA